MIAYALWMKDETDSFITNNLEYGLEFQHTDGYRSSFNNTVFGKLITTREGGSGTYNIIPGQRTFDNDYVNFGPSDGTRFDNINIPGYDNSTGVYSGSTSISASAGAVAPVDSYAMLLAGSFNCASDMNLKKNVVTIENALDKLDGMRGVYHDWVDENNKEHSIGVIAQEVQAVYPELVHEGSDGYLSVNYPKLTAVLLQAIKELKALVLAK
jgi:hypothetical protein